MIVCGYNSCEQNNVVCFRGYKDDVVGHLVKEVVWQK